MAMHIAHKLIASVYNGEGCDLVIEYDVDREMLLIHNDLPGDEHDMLSLIGGAEIDNLIDTLVAIRARAVNIV